MSLFYSLSQCWNSCSLASSSNKQSTDTMNAKQTIDMIELKILSMVRDGALTSAHITWKSSLGSPSQCLVTWEVYGGGIMGNLLTDTPEAELSLWSDSKYHIQVTCKNKVSIVITVYSLNCVCMMQCTVMQCILN